MPGGNLRWICLETTWKPFIKSTGKVYAHVKMAWIETETKGGRGIDFSAIIQENLALLGYLCRQKAYKNPKDFSQVKSLGNKLEMTSIRGR